MTQRLFGLALALLLALPALSFTSDAQAQALNVGFTDHELLIVNMDAYRTVREQLQASYQESQADLQAQAQDFQQKVDRYQKQQALLSPERRTERETELQQLQQQIQAAAGQADQRLAEREAELMQPLMQQVQEAINAVAEEKGLDLVLRTQINVEPVILYINPETVTDITLDVARRLGIDVDEEDVTGVDGTAATGNSSN